MISSSEREDITLGSRLSTNIMSLDIPIIDICDSSISSFSLVRLYSTLSPVLLTSWSISSNIKI